MDISSNLSTENDYLEMVNEMKEVYDVMENKWKVKVRLLENRLRAITVTLRNCEEQNRGHYIKLNKVLQLLSVLNYVIK